MDRLIYKRGNLFEAPPGSLLTHSTNAQGSMGSGVALEFKKQAYNAFKKYESHCLQFKNNKPSPLVGTSFLAVDEISQIKMLCLFTSEYYGKFVSPPSKIIESTRNALDHFAKSSSKIGKIEIHSPKINAGLFKTPWEETENVIKEFLLKMPNATWTVWEL